MSKIVTLLKAGTTFSVKSSKGERAISFTEDGLVSDTEMEFEKWQDISTPSVISLYLKGEKDMVVLRWDLKKTLVGVDVYGSGVEVVLNNSESNLFSEILSEKRESPPISTDAPLPEAKKEGEGLLIGVLSNLSLESTEIQSFKKSSATDLSSLTYMFEENKELKLAILSDNHAEINTILIHANEALSGKVEVIAVKPDTLRVSSFGLTREFLSNNIRRLETKTKKMNIFAALKETCKERNTKTLVLQPNIEY